MAGQTQSANLQRASVTIPTVLAATLLVGAIGGFALGAGLVPSSQSQAVSTAGAGTERTALIPRSAREDDSFGSATLSTAQSPDAADRNLAYVESAWSESHGVQSPDATDRNLMLSRVTSGAATDEGQLTNNTQPTDDQK